MTSEFRSQPGTRVDGNFRQVAAIKTVRYGLGAPELVARFHREREILARMDHPGIARTGAGHFGTVDLWFQHGEVLADLERHAEAEEVLQRALQHLPAPEEYPYILRARVLDTLARVWTATGRQDQAAQALKESREIVETLEEWGHS